MARIPAKRFASIGAIRGVCSFSDFGFRPSFGFRISDFGLGIAACLFANPVSLIAATNLISPDDIPPLRPVRPELPPTFWELYGGWIIAGAVVLVLALCAFAWLLTRPRPPVPIPASVVARRGLEPLQSRREDGVLLSQVSQILRHYVTGAFDLPPGELTTAEFCRAISSLDTMGPALSVPLTDFLRECDRRKFAPDGSTPQPLEAVAQALRFLNQCEACLAQLRASTMTPGPSQHATTPSAPPLRSPG